jgi:hypothetical protein
VHTHVGSPNEMIMFGNRSKFMWEAEGSCSYGVPPPATPDPSFVASQIDFKWKTPLVTDADR